MAGVGGNGGGEMETTVLEQQQQKKLMKQKKKKKEADPGKWPKFVANSMAVLKVEQLYSK